VWLYAYVADTLAPKVLRRCASIVDEVEYEVYPCMGGPANGGPSSRNTYLAVSVNDVRWVCHPGPEESSLKNYRVPFVHEECWRPAPPAELTR
jgi:hypothetical protein